MQDIFGNTESTTTDQVQITVTTENASNIEFDEMQLNGVLSQFEYYNEIDLYFEYTTDEAFLTDPDNYTGDLQETTPVTVTADTGFDFVLEDLDPQTKYYFRAVGRVESG